MALNIFEGARRVTKLIAVLWLLGWITAAFFQGPPYIQASYSVSFPNPPVHKDTDCKSGEDASTYLDVRTKKGTKASVKICFIAMRASNGETVVPYAIQGNGWVGKSPYTTEVRAYTERVKTNFILDKDTEEWIDKQVWPDRLSQMGQGALIAIIGLVALWVVSWSIGWIVRGFMGVPRGKDFRSDRTGASS